MGICLLAKSLQLCPTLCDPMDCSLPGPFVHGIFQTRILEWVSCPPAGDLPNPGSSAAIALQSDSLLLSCNAGDLGSIPGSGRAPEKGMANHSIHYPCLENYMDRGRGPWGCKESDVPE